MKKENPIIILVVVLVLVILGWWMMKNNSGSNPTPVATDQPVSGVEDTTTGSVDSRSPAASLSYSQALAKFANARLQLDKICQASPDKMTFKNNALLMVDNRAPVARTVKVGSTFSIKAYGFKIVALSSSRLPATWLVNCDTSKNVSSILIEK